MKLDGVKHVSLEPRMVSQYDRVNRISRQETQTGLVMEFENGQQVWVPISAEVDVDLVRVSLNQTPSVA